MKIKGSVELAVSATIECEQRYNKLNTEDDALAIERDVMNLQISNMNYRVINVQDIYDLYD